MMHRWMQAARKIAIAKFRAGRVARLVVTDVAARGLDIPLLDNVVNYGEQEQWVLRARPLRLTMLPIMCAPGRADPGNQASRLPWPAPHAAHCVGGCGPCTPRLTWRLHARLGRPPGQAVAPCAPLGIP